MNDSNLNNNQNEEVDLVDVINTIIDHKKKYFIGIFLGLTIGLIYTYATPPLYSTLFKVTVSHSGIGTGFLLKSGGIKSMLDDSQLNKDKFPNISLNKKSGIFTVVSKTNSISDSINSKFKKYCTKN